MKEFFFRDGKLKPIKVLITGTWVMLLVLWIVLIAAAVMVTFFHAAYVEFIDVLLKGIAGLLGQLMVTLTADIYSKKIAGKLQGGLTESNIGFQHLREEEYD